MVSTSATALRARFRSHRIANFTESVIREMTRLAVHHGAVNLAQGFPDFPAPDVLKQAAADAIDADLNQYTITWGARPFATPSPPSTASAYGLDFDPEREITVCCGATEGMIASLLATTQPRRRSRPLRALLRKLRPRYPALRRRTPRYVTLHAPDWTFDPDELRRAFNPRTKAIILNTPNNPTGKVFSRAELELSPSSAGNSTRSPSPTRSTSTSSTTAPTTFPSLTLPGMRERTILVNSMSKTYSVTGWRVGWVLAPPGSDRFHPQSARLPHRRRRRAPAAGRRHALRPPRAPTTCRLIEDYTGRRDHLVATLQSAGLKCFIPRGAYYVMADISARGLPAMTDFVRHLIETIGVAGVPGSSFYAHPERGRQRGSAFVFVKNMRLWN